MTKTLGQKIAYFFSMLSFLAAVVCALAAIFYEPASAADPIHASLLASVIFFIGVGIVLYVIGTSRLMGILSSKDEEGRDRR